MSLQEAFAARQASGAQDNRMISLRPTFIFSWRSQSEYETIGEKELASLPAHFRLPGPDSQTRSYLKLPPST